MTPSGAPDGRTDDPMDTDTSPSDGDDADTSKPKVRRSARKVPRAPSNPDYITELSDEEALEEDDSSL